MPKPAYLAAILLAATPLLHAGPAIAQDASPQAGAGQEAVWRIGEIAVQGNQRIEAGTIISYLGITQGGPYDPDTLDRGLKSLYETGFFADLNLKAEPMAADQLRLIVEVIENPVVGQISLEGNKRLSDDDLSAELQLQPRAVYTRTKVQQDRQRILDLYRRSGRYATSVEPKIIIRDQNRVDVAFEIDEGPASEVRQIDFVGNKVFDNQTLREVIRTSEASWYKLFADDTYDQDRILYDQELLRRFYVNQGYADFQVTSNVAELSADKKSFYLTFTVSEGPKYNFGEVTVENALKNVPTESLQPLLTTDSGDVYNAEGIEKSIDSMTEALGDQGYAFIEIRPKMQRNPETRTIDLTYNVGEGPRVYVERIDIEGNSRTLDKVIRREFRLSEGDPYSTSQLARSEERINNLGFFEKVSVTSEPGATPDRTVVNVDVKEKSTGEISVGAGFSSIDGALADFGVRENNFLGRGQELRFRAMLAQERQQFDIGFTEPYFLDRELRAGFDIFKTTQDFSRESSFDRETHGGALRLGYTFTEHLRHDLRYILRQSEITDVDANASRYIRDQEGTNVTSAIGQTITWDWRNNRIDPSDGYYIELDEELAGLGGDSRYIAHELKAGNYIPLTEDNDWVFYTAATGGAVFGIGEEVFIQDRYFLGGRKLRGFDTAGVGPRDITTQDALGGNFYYTGTAELRFPLPVGDDLGLTGATFLDVGSLWNVDDSGPEVVDDGALRLSYGVGMQWKSPFGPIRIDFALPILKEDYDVTQSIEFSFGTQF